MIVFGEANFMLPCVIFFWGGFHSWDNVVFPDLLKRSCCVTCPCVALTLKQLRSDVLRDRPSNTLNPKIFVQALLMSIKRESNWFKGSTFDGEGWTQVWFCCLFVSVFLCFCRISGQLNCGAANGYFRGECPGFPGWKMLFFMIGVIMSHNSNSFFLVSRV